MSQKKSLNCRFFPECGGCDYLDLTQEEYQNKKIADLKKIINSDIKFFWIGPQTRRKIILQIDENNNLGFFAKSSKSVVQVDSCYICEPEISQLILPLQNFLKNFENNLITQIAITNFDNVVDVIFFVKREFNFTQNKNISNLAQALNINASYRIKNDIRPIYFTKKNQINYQNISLNLEGDIFIQATKLGLEKIILEIRNFILENFNKKISLIDIYAGFGTYSFAVFDLAKEIIACEGSEKMVQLINENSYKNSLANKIKGQMRDLILHPISAKELNKFDLAIINPPRNGASLQALEIAKSSLKKLIYVSCNPQSFARDSAILSENGFKITKIIAIDQFYASPHLELVATFVKV